MFTYHRQQRRLRVLGTTRPTFPADCSITLTISPGQTLGAGPGPVRAIRQGSDCRIEWNANTDRSWVEPNPPFPPVSVSVALPDGLLAVTGDRITYTAHFATREAFLETLPHLSFTIPALLTSSLPDPVFLTATEGRIGEVPFRIEHSGTALPLRVLDDPSLASLVTTALERLPQISELRAIRLLAAVHYIHTAARLLHAGYSPWEFMGEALLNYSKALEVLFGDSRDEQRAGLLGIGLDVSLVEGRFIPVTLLRDFLDVAHPRLSQLDDRRTQGIYQFILGVESDFQTLISTVSEAMTNNRWQPLGYVPAPLDAKELASIDRIIAADQARNAEAAKMAEAKGADA